MAHRDAHPQPVPGCFGCKVSAGAGIGYDGGHLTRERVDRDRRGKVQAVVTEHRSGRQDVNIHAPRVRHVTQATEARD